MKWFYVPLIFSGISLLALLTIYMLILRNKRAVTEYRRRKLRKRVKEIVTPEKKETSPVPTAITVAIFIILLSLALSHKIFWVVVVSNSMSPTFERGDMVLMQSISVHPEKGDIILFYSGDYNLPVTHRVLDVRGNLVYTGGDASGPDSKPSPIRSIVAKAITVGGRPIVIKNAGYYFILDATKLRDVGPYGQEYLFYKNLVNAFRSYALAIVIICIVAYLYLELRDRRPI